MIAIFDEIIEKYPEERKNNFKNNPFASKVRHELSNNFKDEISKLIKNPNNYDSQIIIGTGNWFNPVFLGVSNKEFYKKHKYGLCLTYFIDIELEVINISINHSWSRFQGKKRKIVKEWINKLSELLPNEKIPKGFDILDKNLPSDKNMWKDIKDITLISKTYAFNDNSFKDNFLDDFNNLFEIYEYLTPFYEEIVESELSSSNEGYKWVPFYMEFADKLLEYKDNRNELINKLYTAFDNADIQLATMDVDKYGNSIIPKDIDPFTVFATFNKQLSDKNRSLIVQHIKEEFNLISQPPSIFTGIPVVNNQKATFAFFEGERDENDIDNLWEVFKAAINYSNQSSTNNFISSYDKVLNQRGIKWNITMGLFWIRPYNFISLDQKNRTFLSLDSNLSSSVANLVKSLKYDPPEGKNYLEICNDCSQALKNNDFKYTTFPELSYCAYIEVNGDDGPEIGIGDIDVETNRYWAYSPGPGAQFWDEFYKESIIAVGWDEISDLYDYNSKEEIKESFQQLNNDDSSHVNDVLALWQFANEMQIGDIVFVKKGMSKIIGSGIIESDYIYDNNRQHYKHVRKIKWIKNGDWDYEGKLPMKTLTDISNFTEMLEKIKESLGDIETPEIIYPQYNEEDFLNEVYMSQEDYFTLKEILLNKKNLIVQGAPGVGKTFLAKRLAYSILGEKDINKVMMVQFHQSYSYEDFVMGYRPSKEGFELKLGSFYKFCKKAEEDDENKYFFIIDEINRGNLSKIFGELFMLIENDKRGDKNKIRLLYSDELFSIPKNLYIIGLMNTADRSLAMIDYALRRRFSFFDLKPGFSSVGFKNYKEEFESSAFNNLIDTMKELNKEIKEDETLGEGFRIGHSYFCNLKDEEKLNFIVEYEIIPLLKEYWFDEPEKVAEWSERLRNSLFE